MATLMVWCQENNQSEFRECIQFCFIPFLDWLEREHIDKWLQGNCKDLLMRGEVIIAMQAESSYKSFGFSYSPKAYDRYIYGR